MNGLDTNEKWRAAVVSNGLLVAALWGTLLWEPAMRSWLGCALVAAATVCWAGLVRCWVGWRAATRRLEERRPDRGGP